MKVKKFFEQSFIDTATALQIVNPYCHKSVDKLVAEMVVELNNEDGPTIIRQSGYVLSICFYAGTTDVLYATASLDPSLVVNMINQKGLAKAKPFKFTDAHPITFEHQVFGAQS